MYGVWCMVWLQQIERHKRLGCASMVVLDESKAKLSRFAYVSFTSAEDLTPNI